jgi:sugar phosphate permease
MMNFFFVEDFTHFAVAAVGAAVVGALVSWLIDYLWDGEREDDSAVFALGAVVAFLFLMAATTLYLTAAASFLGGPIVIPSLGFALSYLVGTAAAGVLRMVLRPAPED